MEIINLEEKESFIESLCSTDEQVNKIVDVIRKDIIPLVKDNIMATGEKVIVRSIFIKEAEETKSGLIAVQGQKSNISVTKFYKTHPYQGVVVSIGSDIKSTSLKVGDHILMRSNISGELNRDTVIINGIVFGHAFFTDIICSIKD